MERPKLKQKFDLTHCIAMVEEYFDTLEGKLDIDPLADYELLVLDALFVALYGEEVFDWIDQTIEP